MFDRVQGLPAHPLFIHAAVVLVPLLAVTGIVYAVWAGSRRHIRWPLVALAILTPGAVFFAKESGESFSSIRNFQSAEMQADIARHEDFADVLFLLVLGLAIVALVMAFLVRVSADSTSLIKAPIAVHWVVVVLAVALGLASVYYVFQTGDSGARMVWDGF